VAGAGGFTTTPMPTPYGFSISGNHVVVAHTSNGAANFSTVATYSVPSYNNNANTATLACTPICCEQTMASRVVTSADGKYAYVTNFGSNSISSFTVGFDGSLHVMKNVEATTGAAPTDVALSNNESYLYTINASSHTISEYKKSPNGRLNNMGEISGLPAFATGLVAL